MGKYVGGGGELQSGKSGEVSERYTVLSQRCHQFFTVSQRNTGNPWISLGNSVNI